MKILKKIGRSLLAILPMLFLGFFTFIIFEMFYFQMSNYVYVVIVLATLWMCVIARIWFTQKNRKIIRLAVLGLAVLSGAGYGIIQSIDANVPVVGDDLDLGLYSPFMPNTKAVALEEASSWKMTEPLLRIDGATAFYPLYAAFAQAVYPEGDYDPNVWRTIYREDGEYYSISWEEAEYDYVVCTTTATAYERLIDGKTDMIFVYGPSKEHQQLAEEKGVTLTLTPIGYDAFVFFVNAKNPVDGLSSENIRRIYSGQVTNWRELSGKNTEIKAYQRSENSGSQTIMIEFMGDTPLMTPPYEQIAYSMTNIITAVSYKNYRHSIGYSFLFFATEMVSDNQIKLLSIDGVAPTRENVANGTYPLTSTFYAVTAGADNPNAEAFIEWILSPQGRYLMEKTGYTPVR